MPKQFETDPLALVIADMFREVLATDSVTPTDDFFSLGGDSLAALEICAKIEARFGVVSDPVEVFEHPVVRDLASYVSAQLGSTIATEP